MYKSTFLNEAMARGFFYQATNLEAMDEYLSTNMGCGYLGIDVTAPCLHVGHLVPIFLMRLFQKHGGRPILLLGGGTTKIGDPSFKNTARPMLADEKIKENALGIKKCLEPLLHFGTKANDAVMVNNADWLDHLEYMPFLRDIGTYFSVNRMIGFDSVKAKLSENNSLSFLEFNYMVLQAYDFMHLFSKENCKIQFSGQDQWGNIVCGVELIRKKLNQEVFGFTVPLLLNSDGKKMGKTVNGAVWISSELLSPYDFWQYWRNVNDADVIKLMYMFTDIPVDEIKKMEKIQGAELNELKKLLADEVTSIIHGKDSLCAIHDAVEVAFGGKNLDLSKTQGMATFEISSSELTKISITELAVKTGMCESKSDAKRLLRGRGIYVNDSPIDESFTTEELQKSEVVKMSFGKKKHVLIKII